jgi:hypothetical protein
MQQCKDAAFSPGGEDQSLARLDIVILEDGTWPII